MPAGGIGATKPVPASTHVRLDVERTLKALGDVANRLPRTVSVGVRSGVNHLVRHVTTSKLRGQILRRRTGTLIRSITASPRFEASPESVKGIFGSHLDYARYHEEGYAGPVRVPAHVQKAHSVGPYTRRQHMRKGHRIRTHLVRRHRVRAHSVRAHEAIVDIPAKHFLRDTIREAGPEAVARIRRAIIHLMRHRKPPNASDLAGGTSAIRPAGGGVP